MNSLVAGYIFLPDFFYFLKAQKHFFFLQPIANENFLRGEDTIRNPKRKQRTRDLYRQYDSHLYHEPGRTHATRCKNQTNQNALFLSHRYSLKSRLLHDDWLNSHFGPQHLRYDSLVFQSSYQEAWFVLRKRAEKKKTKHAAVL